jgi:hypothetical protein
MNPYINKKKKKGRTVDEYINDFYQLVTRNYLLEPEKQLVTT